jgi:hypothetical protein
VGLWDSDDSNWSPQGIVTQAMGYQLVLQAIDAAGAITSSPAISVKVPVTQGLYQPLTGFYLPAGAVDQQIPLIRPDFIDFLVLFPNQGISYKLNTLADIPKPIRGGGVALEDSQNITGLWLSNAGSTDAIVNIAQARGQALPTP